MKKIILLPVLLAAVLLGAAEYQITGWTANVIRGKFTFDRKAYPLKISCSQATKDKSGVTGVWGRFYCKKKLEIGKKYKFKVTYRLFNIKAPGRMELWIRGSKKINCSIAEKAGDEKPRTICREFTPDVEDVSLFLNLREAPGDLEIISAELIPVDK